MDSPPSSDVLARTQFVAVNTIHCEPNYLRRFEELFTSRAHAIDRIPGFLAMHVLKPAGESEPYLVVSYWESKRNFDGWVGSPEFLEGHKRAFEDLRLAKGAGTKPPMTSSFSTYSILAN